MAPSNVSTGNKITGKSNITHLQQRFGEKKKGVEGKTTCQLIMLN